MSSRILSAKYRDGRLARYSQMAPSLQFGNLASNLFRLGRYIEKERPLESIREIAGEARDFVDLLAQQHSGALATMIAIDAYLHAILIAESNELKCLGKMARRMAEAVEMARP